MRVRRAGALLALAGVSASGTAIAIGAAGGPSPLTPSSRGGFPGWMAGPLAGLVPEPLGDGFWLLVAAMAACYLAALALADRIGARAAVATVLALHIVFLLAPPLLTTDPFGYLAYARLSEAGGPSPYSAGLTALPDADPVRAFVGWERGPSPYGPLFTLVGMALTPLGLAGGLWGLKALAAGASLLTLAFVWRLAPRLGRSPVQALIFAGLNPVLLVWGVAGAHNDLVVAALVLAAALLLVRAREGLGAGVAALAAGVKVSAGVLLPLLVAGARARRRALAGAIVGLAAGAAAGVAALGPSGLAGYPAAVAAQAGYVSENSVVDLLGASLGLGGAAAGLRVAATVLLVLGTVLLCARLARARMQAGRGERTVAGFGWATLLALVTTTWLMAWYVVLVLPLAAVSPDRRLRVATLALCAFVVVTRVPLGRV